jgi:hypothetical protein
MNLNRAMKLPSFTAEYSLSTAGGQYLRRWDFDNSESRGVVQPADNICNGGGGRCHCAGNCVASSSGCHCMPQVLPVVLTRHTPKKEPDAGSDGVLTAVASC